MCGYFYLNWNMIRIPNAPCREIITCSVHYTDLKHTCLGSKDVITAQRYVKCPGRYSTL